MCVDAWRGGGIVEETGILSTGLCFEERGFRRLPGANREVLRFRSQNEGDGVG